MKIFIEQGNLKATKSCEICAHKDVCKFYSKAKELFQSNEFYEMTEYLEWNNNLLAWSDNKDCQYYLPFIFDKKLFALELKKKNTFINSYAGWYDLVMQYFKSVYKSKHEDYFNNELLKQKEKEWAKEKTDEELYKYCIERYSNNKIYTIVANDKSFKYEITLLEVLEFFNAFKS